MEEALSVLFMVFGLVFFAACACFVFYLEHSRHDRAESQEETRYQRRLQWMTLYGHDLPQRQPRRSPRHSKE